jgi:hypothetical protein
LVYCLLKKAILIEKFLANLLQTFYINFIKWFLLI